KWTSPHKLSVHPSRRRMRWFVPEEFRLQAEKMRVYALAKTLDVESKTLLDYCKELGYDVKNQLSSIDPDQAAALTDRVKRGNQGGVAVAAPTFVPPVNANLTNKVKTLTVPRKPTPEPVSKTTLPSPATKEELTISTSAEPAQPPAPTATPPAAPA